MRKWSPTEILLSCGLCAVLLLTLRESVMITFPVLSIILWVLVWNLALQLAVRFWKITLPVLGAAVALLLLWVFFRDGDIWVAQFVDDYLSWIAYASAGSSRSSGFLPLSTALLTFLFSLPIFMLVRYNAHVLLLLVIGMSVFVGMQLAYLWYPGYLLWAFLLLTLLLALRQGAHWRLGQTRYLLCMLPVCALLLLGISRLPMENTEPVGEPLIQSVKDWLMAEEFVPAEMGYFDFYSVGDGLTGDRELGGSFTPSNRTMLYLQAERPMYVRGSAAATYTQRKWTDFEQGQWYSYNNPFYMQSSPYIKPPADSAIANADVVLEKMQLMHIVNLLQKHELSELDFSPYLTSALSGQSDSALYKVKQATIHYWDINTQSMFLPEYFLYTDNQMNSKRYNPRMNRHGSLSINGAYGKDDYYDFTYLMYPFTDEFWDQLMNLSYPGYAWELYLAMLEQGIDDRYLMTFAMREQTVAENYLQLPQLPRRVIDLAQEITKDADTTHQKAKAIETYLSDNYPYSLDVPDTPSGEDFVDYFLFDLKRGYCTYYATAMVVMCRAVGIPARYVEGFVFAPEPYQGFYVATGMQAHAWAEVYLDGLGWFSYEPTAGYSEGFYDSLRDPDVPVTPTPAPSSTPRPTPTPAPSNTPRPTPVPTPTPAPVESEELHPLAVFIERWLWAVLTVAALAGWMGFNRYRRKRFLRRLRAAGFSGNDAVMIYQRCLRLMRLLRLKPRLSETPQEFARRCDDTLLLQGTMTPAAEAYYAVTFGHREPDAEQCQAMLHALTGAEAALTGRWKAPVVWLVRYMTGMV